MIVPSALLPERVTILAYGALLSESSSRLTFPALSNFRLVRVSGWRRLFGMSHLFLTGQGVADPNRTLRLAALSVEPAEGSSFIAAAYEVNLDDAQRASFLEREKGYEITTATYRELAAADGDGGAPPGLGVICGASSDDKLPAGLVVPASLAGRVWDWPPDSGLLPADVYLRHCLLAIGKIGGAAERSFLHDTLLVDRTTTLASYLEGGVREEVMAVQPPEAMAARFGG